jgi:hypothetical protein
VHVLLKAGFVAFCAECVIHTVLFAWLALR